MNTISPIEKLVLELYINQGKGQNPVIKQTGISKNELKLILEKNGYHLRNRHESIIAANKRRNKLQNQEYFSTQTHNMAWLMGFLAADGSIEKNRNVIKLALSTIDKEILEKIREEIQLEVSVKDYVTAKGFQMSKIQWSSEQHKKDLSQYGIIPQKTFNLKPPYKLKKEYWIDYIRGYFDGDGSVYITKNNYNTITWEIGSATKEILEFIRDFFYEEYGIPKTNIHETVKKEPFYVLMYSTNAAKKIYKHFYENEDVLSLKRKKDKYTEIIKLKNNN